VWPAAGPTKKQHSLSDRHGPLHRNELSQKDIHLPATIFLGCASNSMRLIFTDFLSVFGSFTSAPDWDHAMGNPVTKKGAALMGFA